MEKPEQQFTLKWKAIAAVMIMVCASLFTGVAIGSGDGGRSIPVVIESGSGVETASYIIYKDGDYTCAKNGTTGRILVRNEDAAISFQAACNALQSSGGKIALSHGIYYGTQTVFLYEGIYIIGVGRAQLNNTYDQNNGSVYVNTATDGSPAFAFGKISNAVGGFADITIRGNPNSGVGIYLNHTTRDFQIQDCTIEEHGSDGIFVSASVGLIIENCHISNNAGNGLRINDSSYSCKITNNIFNTNYPSNLNITAQRGSYTIIGNTFENGIAAPGDHIVVNSPYAYLDFSHNVLATTSNETRWGVSVESVMNVVVSNNILNDNGYGISISNYYAAIISENVISNNYYGVFVDGSGNSCLISENEITNNAGIGINCSTPYCRIESNSVITSWSASNKHAIITSGVGAIISDNYIRSATKGVYVTGVKTIIIGNYVDADNTGIDIYNNDVQILSNKLIGGTYGILINSKSRCVIDGNYVTGVTYYGINLLTASYSSVSNNIVNASGQHGIMVYDSDYCAISGNVITNSGQTTTNTYADISIRQGSTYNSITGNSCYSGLSNKAKYNLWEESGDYNVIVGNVFRGGVTGTNATTGAHTIIANNQG